MPAPAAPHRGHHRGRAGHGSGIARGRSLRNAGWWALCAACLVLVVIPVAWILWSVTSKAVAGWHWNVLTNIAGGAGIGLSNAIAGTFVLMAGVGVIIAVVGIGSGIYLSEVARPGPVRTVLRGASEVLSGVPSIVFGYVGYLALVVGLHWGYSLLSALIVLSMLVVPYVAKATELALGQVPLAYREGGEALGMSRTHVLRRIVLKAAVPGIATGLILALAISVGETAPLLYTAGWTGSYPSASLIHAPIGYLTYATFTFYDEPSAAARQLSYDAGFLLVLLVLALILAARLVTRLSQKHSPDRGTRSTGRAGRRATRAAQAAAGSPAT